MQSQLAGITLGHPAYRRVAPHVGHPRTPTACHLRSSNATADPLSRADARVLACSSRGASTVCRAASVVEAPVASQPALSEVLAISQPGSNILVSVGKDSDTARVVVTVDPPRENLVLHWGVNSWQQLPPQGVWPPGSVQAGDVAVQTLFCSFGRNVTIDFPQAVCPSQMVFVLNEGDRWTSNSGQDFVVDLNAVEWQSRAPVVPAAASPEKLAAAAAAAAANPPEALAATATATATATANVAELAASAADSPVYDPETARAINQAIVLAAFVVFQMIVAGLLTYLVRYSS